MASERDDVALSHETAVATLQIAEARRSALRHENEAIDLALERLQVREANLSLLEKEVELANADVTAAETEIDATIIRASADGWVAERIIETGGSVRVGDPVISVWVGEAVWIDAWVEESALGDVKVGSKVDVQLAAHPDDVLVGEVSAIGVVSDWEREPDPTRPIQPTGMTSGPKVPVRVALPTTDARVMPGLSATVGIHSSSTDGSFSIRRALTAVIP